LILHAGNKLLDRSHQLCSFQSNLKHCPFRKKELGPEWMKTYNIWLELLTILTTIEKGRKFKDSLPNQVIPTCKSSRKCAYMLEPLPRSSSSQNDKPAIWPFQTGQMGFSDTMRLLRYFEWLRSFRNVSCVISSRYLCSLTAAPMLPKGEACLWSYLQSVKWLVLPPLLTRQSILVFEPLESQCSLNSGVPHEVKTIYRSFHPRETIS